MTAKPAEPQHRSHRAFRIPDPLYESALAKAREQGVTLTSVVCKALERYVKQK